jgi:hypothetical protein
LISLVVPAFVPRSCAMMCPYACLHRATAPPPTLVCRPSSRALRLQVPLPTIRARTPLDLSILLAVLL